MVINYDTFPYRDLNNMDSFELTEKYLNSCGFAPLRIIDLSKYPAVHARLSFLQGYISYLMDYTADGNGWFLFGGAVRDAVSGLQRNDTDFDFVVDWANWNAIFNETCYEPLLDTSKIPPLLHKILQLKRFRGVKRLMPLQDEEKRRWIDNDCSNNIFSFDESATYWQSWGGLKGFLEIQFEGGFIPTISTKYKNPPSDLLNKAERLVEPRKVQVMTSVYTSRPEWAKSSREDFFETAQGIDPIEHVAKLVRMVDLTSCGLMLYYGRLLEAVPGAFDDALNRRIRRNPQVGVSFHNTEKRIGRLVERGYSLA
jgi:hypothetical protein